MSVTAEMRPLWRDRVLAAIAVVCGAVLVATMLYRAVRDPGGTNAYAAIAESFIKGTPDVSTCIGADCAHHDGKLYEVFPPLPGVLAMPLVWLNGLQAKGFIALSLIMYVASLWVWNRNFAFLNPGTRERRWLLTALAFASPLYYVALRGDGVWFFAQSLGFLLVATAIHEAMVGKRLLTAGIAIGAALLCRQMSMFYVPLLLLLWLGPDAPLLRISKARIIAVITICVPVAVGLLLYFSYNYWRFADPFETGYKYMVLDAEPLHSRLENYGLWSNHYALFNFLYLTIQGFHIDFVQPLLIKVQGLDPSGTSILAASPWLLLLFFVPLNRFSVVALTMAIAFSFMLLQYHSNGFSQYNTQRYTLDWIPAILVVLAPLLTTVRLEWVRLLIVWGMVLNVAMVIVLALTKTG